MYIVINGSLLRRGALGLFLLFAILLPAWLLAGTVNLPHTFRNGDVADANEVNANFLAVKSAVDDNAAHIAALSFGARQVTDVVLVQASLPLSNRRGSNCVDFDRDFYRNAAFTIPEGRVFVVTSVDWQAPVPTRASKTVVALLFLFRGEATNGPAAITSAIADSDGLAAGTITFPTGIIVTPGQQLCIAAPLAPLGSNEYAPADAVAHGFFTDAQ